MLTIKMLSISTLVLSIGLITGSPASGKGEKADSASVSRRLAAAKSLALILEADAADLTSFAKGKKDWSGQVQMERRISADMSKAKETARELQEMQDIASPGQVAVIRRVTPLVGDLIANTRLTIQHLTADPGEAH